MDRVVKLLEQQRLQQQALLAHLQDQRLQSDFANQVLKSVLNSHGEAQCMQLLEQATPASVMDIRDAKRRVAAAKPKKPKKIENYDSDSEEGSE